MEGMRNQCAIPLSFLGPGSGQDRAAGYHDIESRGLVARARSGVASEHVTSRLPLGLTGKPLRVESLESTYWSCLEVQTGIQRNEVRAEKGRGIEAWRAGRGREPTKKNAQLEQTGAPPSTGGAERQAQDSSFQPRREVLILL